LGRASRSAPLSLSPYRLEMKLRKFTCLTKGDHVRFRCARVADWCACERVGVTAAFVARARRHNDITYELEVLELKPAVRCCCRRYCCYCCCCVLLLPPLLLLPFAHIASR
jgi:hypothetical protein